MSIATTPETMAALSPLEIPGPVALVPSLDILHGLTETPERRVVFRGVDWPFYETLVNSIPEGSNIHVNYDGKDLEVMSTGRKHELAKKLLSRFVETVAEEMDIPYRPAGQTTWKRPEMARGLEADECYYFQPASIAQDVAALERGSDDIADYPNPDLAIEVDLSSPQVDRPGIYAALRVSEIWRLDGERIIIERLTPEQKYQMVEFSSFLPVRAEEIRQWVIQEGSRDLTAWARRLRAEIRRKRADEPPRG